MLLATPVTPNYFSLLGVQTAMGQASVEAADGQPRVVLGYRVWQQRFGGDPAIVNKPVILSGRRFLVAGVMREEFTGLKRGLITDVWLNHEAWFTNLGNRGDQVSHRGQFELVARLRPGIARERAAAQLDAARHAFGSLWHTMRAASVSERCGVWLTSHGGELSG